MWFPVLARKELQLLLRRQGQESELMDWKGDYFRQNKMDT